MGMSKGHHPPGRLRRAGIGVMAACVIFWIGCSSSPPKPNLPPSASDLPLLRSADLCTDKSRFLAKHEGAPSARRSWGTGEEIQFQAFRGAVPADESYFFDQDGLLVGFLMTFPPGGLPLKPYPVLRDTLSQLKPWVEFYLDLARVPAQAGLETATLYATGEEKTTTWYLVTGEDDSSRLLSTSHATDPYSRLMSPYRKTLLSRLAKSQRSPKDRIPESVGAEDPELFATLQQFARGQTASLKYCGVRRKAIAVDAYRQAIAKGFSSKKYLAEAHHKLGLALLAQGDLEQARDEMVKSSEVYPDRAKVLNSLGTVYEKLGDHKKALAAFERAITLKPNYAIARFNLAEAYEGLDVRLAVQEYETYLALASDIPEEAARIQRARERVKALSR
ncbi:MAG: tetratricopeptide repeat protein [Nitrospirales bacterium]